MKEIKSRIKSVQSTRQITNAMEIVSTTKFKRYSKLVTESRPYEESMRKILENIASGVKNEGHPLFDGRKAIDFITKRNYDFSESFSKISADEMNKIAREISEEVVEKYNNHIYDEVYVIYNKFVSALRYDLTCERIIPIARPEVELNSEYIFEPSTEYILSALLPRFINLQIYQAILNNTASEHSARKNSMSSATDNADEMIKTLNIKYNRNRQSAITQEITEIVGGASAL